MLRSRRSASLALLAARARGGERRAAAALRARMAPDLRQLALVLGADPTAVAGVVRRALDDALADSATPFPTAAVVALQRRTAAAVSVARGGRPAPDRLRSAVGVLCDLQGHSPAAAAALLGQPVSTVTALHAASRSDLGVDARRSDCRGWPLVARLDELTAPEQAAGRAHLGGCRPCRDAVDARAAARTRLQAAVPIGGTAAAGGVLALVSALGGGSMAAGGVAVGAAAVLGTAGVMVPVLPDRPPPAEVAPAPARPAGGTDEAPSGPSDATGPAGDTSPVDPGVPLLPAGTTTVPLGEAPPAGAVTATPAPTSAPPAPAGEDPVAGLPAAPLPDVTVVPVPPVDVVPDPTLPPPVETEPPGTVTDPLGTVLDPALQPLEPALEPLAPVTEPVEPALEPVLEPVTATLAP